MANMGYCRFENTLRDLQDCIEHLSDNNLSEREQKSRDLLISLMEETVLDYCDDIDFAADIADSTSF